MRRRGAFVVMAAAALAFTGPAIVRGRTLAATDIVVAGAPYAARSPVEPPVANTLQVDQAEQLPLVAEFWDGVRHGRLQLWEPDVGGGVPLMSGAYNRVLTPWYVTFLFLPAWLAPTVALAIAFFVAELGTYWLARRLGLSVIAATVAAVAYAFSGPAITFVLRINEVFLFPLVLALVHGAVTAERRRGSFVAGLAFVTAGLWFCGFPSAAFFVLYVSVAFAVYLVVRAARGATLRARFRDAVRRGFPAAGAFIAGTAIASIQLLPSLRFLSMSEALDRTYTLSDRAGLHALATALSGKFYGAFQDRDWWLSRADGANAVTITSTMGLVVFALVVLVVIGRRTGRAADHSMSRFFLPVGLVTLFGVYVGGPVLAAIHVLPTTQNSSFVRARFVLSLVVALLAALGVESLARARDAERPSWATRAQAALLLAMIAIGVGDGLRKAASAETMSRVVHALVVPGLALAAALLVVVVLRRRATLRAVVICAAIALELQWGGWGFTPASARAAFYPQDPALERIRGDIGEGGRDRFLALGFGSVRPMSAAYLDLKDVRVAFPSYERYRDLLRAADPNVFDEGRLKTYFTDDLDPSSPILDAMSVRYLAQPLSAPPLGAWVAARAEITETGELTFVAPQAGVRAVKLALDTRDCSSGFVTLEGSAGARRVSVREPVWNAGIFPVPDIGPSGIPIRLQLRADPCVRVREQGVDVYARTGSLELIDVDGWQLYRRPAATPRVSLARRGMVIEDPSKRVAAIASPRSDDTVILSKFLGLPRVRHGRPEDELFRGGTARIARDDPDRVVIDVDSDGPGLLVLRDVNAPGWTASVDGNAAKILEADHAFRGVAVPAGKSSVTFAYRPFPAGPLVVALGLVGAFVLALSTRRWDRPGVQPSVEADVSSGAR